MKWRSVAALLPCLLFVSCARTVRDVSARPAVLERRAERALTGVRETMRRQVRNAVDAGEGDARVREWRRRLAVNPNDLPARLDLARYYTSAGYPELALDHYRIASARFPDNAQVAVALARSLARAGFHPEARDGLDRFLGIHPESAAEGHSWSGILADEAGDLAAGERSHRAALNLRRNSAALHNNLGYNLLLQGRRDEASAQFRRALEIDPANALAGSNLALAVSARPDEAVASWRKVVDPASAHNNVAAAMIESGDYDGARRELGRALALNHGHAAALSNLQLVSELDRGGLDPLSKASAASAWRRFVRTLGIVLVGEPEHKSKQTAAEAGKDVPAS
jgi:Flp pilus assembly protein TadD